MGHSYCSSLYHCNFSTKERRKMISPELQDRLWAYIGGIARENGMTALAVGGTDDHAHLLIAIPATLTVSAAIREIKRGSSLWMHEACSIPHFDGRRATAHSPSATRRSSRQSATLRDKKSTIAAAIFKRSFWRF